MKMKYTAIFFSIILAALFLFSCTTPAPTVVEAETEPVLPAAPEPAEEPVQPEEPVPEPVEEPQEFTVTEEIYERTFQDIEGLIVELNSIIKKTDYNSWLSYLSEDYIDRYSDPQTLDELSQQPLLRKYSIKLTSLRDYFENVVVPSRSNARLDEIVFEDEHHVKAIMLIDGQRTILYQLVYIDNRWKIGI